MRQIAIVLATLIAMMLNAHSANAQASVDCNNGDITSVMICKKTLRSDHWIVPILSYSNHFQVVIKEIFIKLDEIHLLQNAKHVVTALLA